MLQWLRIVLIVPVNPENGWNWQNLHAAVSIQNVSSYEIEGATSFPLTRT
jgi:hypothetical protein